MSMQAMARCLGGAKKVAPLLALLLLGMLGKIPRPTPAMAVALLALLIAASGAAVAVIPSADGTITACQNNRTGALRVINAEDGQTCTSKEIQLAWKDGITGKVADSERLDGQDSTAFEVTMKTNYQETGECDSLLASEGFPAFNECAPVTVTVPTGRQYHVTVFSSFVAAIEQNRLIGPGIWYCPAIEGGTFELRCLDQGRGTPGDHQGTDVASLESGNHGAYSAEIGPLPAGTYTFSTVLMPDSPLVARDDMRTHTTVLVTDASAPGLPIQ